MMQETHFTDGSGGAAGSPVQLAGPDKQKHCCVFNEPWDLRLGLVFAAQDGSISAT